MSNQSKARPFIIAATSDLFIQSRLKELAVQLGHQILFSVNTEEVDAQASTHDDCLVILDLDASEYESSKMAVSLKRNNGSIRILGYYPHVRTDLQAEAKNAGVDYVVPNSSFLKTVREILERKRAC